MKLASLRSPKLIFSKERQSHQVAQAFEVVPYNSHKFDT